MDTEWKKKDERTGKKITLVYLETARVSYRAGAKVDLKNNIINCHLHLRCKAREQGLEEGSRGGRKKRRYCTVFALEITQ